MRSSTQDDWDQYFLDITNVVRSRSKDPSSKIGALIVSRHNTILATGYNGFARGIADTDKRWERPAKYKRVVHAERNAVYNAARVGGTALEGSTLYLVGFGPPTVPCLDCTFGIIQAGVVRVVGQPYKEVPESWADELLDASQSLAEAGIIVIEWEPRVDTTD